MRVKRQMLFLTPNQLTNIEQKSQLLKLPSVLRDPT